MLEIIRMLFQEELVSLVNKNVGVIWPSPVPDVVEEGAEEGEVEPVSHPPGFNLFVWSLKQFAGC